MSEKKIASIIGQNIEKIKKDFELSNDQLGEILGVTRQTVGKYIRGEQVIDSARLFKLSRFANVSLKYFMQEEQKEEYSYIFRADNPKEKVDTKFLNYLSTLLNSYWDIMSAANETKLRYLPESYQLKIEGNTLSTEDYKIIRSVAEKVRKSFGLENDLNADIFNSLERNNIHIFCFTDEEKTIDALSVYDENKGAFILLNDHKDVPEERKIFSVIHELGHLIFHREDYKKTTEELIYSNYQKDVNEKIVNSFAGYFLIPRKILKEYDYFFRGFLSFRDLLKLKKIFGVSAQAMLYALKEEEYINPQNYGYLLKQLKEKGYTVSEPSPIEPLEKNQKLKFVLKDLFLKEEVTTNKVAEVLNLDNVAVRTLTKEWAEHGYYQN